MRPEQKLQLCLSVILFAAGLSFLFIPYLDAEIIIYFFGILALISAVLLFVKSFKSKRGVHLIEAVCTLIFALFLLMHRQAGPWFVIFLFCVYMFFNFFAFGFQTVLAFREKAKQTWIYGLEAGLYLLAFLL